MNAASNGTVEKGLIAADGGVSERSPPKPINSLEFRQQLGWRSAKSRRSRAAKD